MIAQGLRGLALLGALALDASGCVSTPATQVKYRVETMKSEQSADKLFARGRAFASVGDYTRAEQYLSGALDAGGDEAAIMPVLIGVCVEARRFRVAIDFAEPYLRKHPGDGRLRFVVGTLYMAVGEPATARVKFEEILEQRPNEPETHYALGVVLRDADHDLLRADKHFRAYLRLKPNGDHVEDARASLLKSVP